MTVEESKKYKKTTKIATPSVGIDGVNHAVRALRAYKEPATYKDLAKGAGLHPVYMSQSLSASRDLGLTQYAGKRGLYKFTSDGEEYARFLSYGQESDCKALLKKVILDDPPWSEIIRFLRMSEGQERDPLLLVGDIEGKLGKQWSPSMRNGYANAYTSILEFAGLIRVEGGKIVSKLPSEPEEKPERGKIPPPPPPEEYLEFSIADSFRVVVRKDIDSLGFFEDQVKESSIFTPWIKHEKKKLQKTDSEKGDQD